MYAPDLVPKNWKEQAGEFMKNLDRVNETMNHIYDEVKAELQIEDVDGAPGGLLGCLNKICDFSLEDLETEVEATDIDDDWREIKRQHSQIKFLRMLVIVQVRANQGWKDGGREVRDYPGPPTGFTERMNVQAATPGEAVANSVRGPLMNGEPIYIA